MYWLVFVAVDFSFSLLLNVVEVDISVDSVFDLDFDLLVVEIVD